ncbi:MAG: efflux RND transporter periplasmic adaptor subunit [Phycisphaerales bacterium]|nr:efflux RND transporter periplasmic adaptor subunit [Phycisphaerales bacterium]
MKERTMRHVGRSIGVLVLLGAGLGALTGLGPARGAQPESNSPGWWVSFGGEKAIAKPSQDAVMGFTLSTSVEQVLAKGGQRVKAGDLLVRGDDSEDVAEAKFQRARAETTLPVERAKAQAQLAEVEYQRQMDASDRGAGSELEKDRARVAMETARIDVDLAVLNQVLSDLQASKAEARVQKLSLRAPFDGVVDVVQVDQGQSVREGEPVVRVVAVDPIWIDVPAPTALAISAGLEVGSPAWILLQEDVARRVFTGKVIEVAPTADASSGTRRIRVEMANKVGVVPGVNCWVRFSEPSAEWSDQIVDPSKPVKTAEAQR